MSSAYEGLKDSKLEALKTPLMSVVLYDALINKGLVEDFIYRNQVQFIDYSNGDAYSESYMFLNWRECKEADQIVKNLKQFNVRCSEVSRKIYDGSKLSNYVTYAEVASDLIVSVKAMFILSSSKANPGRVMADRINSMLSCWAEDFRSRSEPTDDICKRAIYLSVFCPNFLKKNDNVFNDAIIKTKGGNNIFRELNKYFKEAGNRSHLKRLMRRAALFFSKRKDWKLIYKVS